MVLSWDAVYINPSPPHLTQVTAAVCWDIVITGRRRMVSQTRTVLSLEELARRFALEFLLIAVLATYYSCKKDIDLQVIWFPCQTCDPLCMSS